jgi:sporulation protein YunB
MIMSVHKPSLKCKFSYFILALSVGIIFMMISFLKQLDSHMSEISSFKGNEIANSVISGAVEKTVDDFSDTEFLTVIRDSENRIVSAQINSAEVNNLSNTLTLRINDSLSDIENSSVKIPIGTLTGTAFFTGRGFNVNLRLQQLGNVKSEMKSSFKSAGINQTKFSLYIEISVEMKAILPFSSDIVTVTNEYLVSETIIVGEIPQVYLSE